MTYRPMYDHIPSLSIIHDIPVIPLTTQSPELGELFGFKTITMIGIRHPPSKECISQTENTQHPVKQYITLDSPLLDKITPIIDHMKITYGQSFDVKWISESKEALRELLKEKITSHSITQILNQSKQHKRRGMASIVESDDQQKPKKAKLNTADTRIASQRKDDIKEQPLSSPQPSSGLNEQPTSQSQSLDAVSTNNPQQKKKSKQKQPDPSSVTPIVTTTPSTVPAKSKNKQNNQKPVPPVLSALPAVSAPTPAFNPFMTAVKPKEPIKPKPSKKKKTNK